MAQTLEVTGASLQYEAFGDGPETIVFVHGAGGNHLSWWNQIPAFSERYRCVTYSTRGWGGSVDRSGEGRRAFRRDLAELMDQLDIPRAALVGQSMGGFSVLPYAVRHPDRVTALLMSGTFLGIDDAKLLDGLLNSLRRALSPEAGNARLGGLTRMVGEAYQQHDPAGVFLYNQIRGLNPPLEAVGPMTFTVEDGAVAVEELAGVKIPVVFVSGSEDALVPPALVKYAAEMIETAQYIEVPTGGHSVYWEQPTIFNKILQDLLATAYP